MDFLKKYWWLVALLIGAVGLYFTFFAAGEKDEQLARAREAKAAKAAANGTGSVVDVEHTVIEPNGTI